MDARRTWGPFTGRQLTTIAVTALLVLVPGTVWAVESFTNVAVMDPVTGTKAGVDSLKRLKVGDGDGAMTVNGTVRAVDGGGPLTVDGRVSSAPVPPGAGVARIAYPSDTCTSGYIPPAGKDFVLTDLTAYVSRNSGSSFAEFDLFRGQGCGDVVFDFLVNATPQAAIETHRSYEPGVVLPDGLSMAAFLGSGGVALRGYLVPEGSVPVASAETAQAGREATGPASRR